ncbi:discoidin domain-containing protein [Collinsella phocaeensis]|uniref:discoidin domain-containing protein n=1 Tax=Collinsella phocaeensis TaxID=1871016 RepID=UPI000A5F9EEE|nr:discoidin domain-containing protein [Collinsella phocaeensis]
MRRGRLAVAAAVAMVGALGFTAPVFAAGSGYGAVSVKQDAGSVTIGNNALTRTFSTAGKKLTTTEINNVLGGSRFVPQDGSEEFYIEQLVESSRVEPGGALTSVRPQGASVAPSATVEVSSTMDESGNKAANAIDGDPSTYWCSVDTAADQWIVIEFDGEKTIKSFEYTPRVSNGSWDCTGRIKAYVLERKQGDQWVEISRGAFDPTGTTVVELKTEVKAAAVRLRATEAYHWDAGKANTAINVAELDVKDASGASVLASAPAAGWSISSTSVQNGDGGGAAALIDGSFETYFHSRYSENGTGSQGEMPVDITIDRGAGATSSFQTVGYAGRKGSATSNGNVKKFELYVSNSEGDLYEEANKKGSFKVDYVEAYDGATPKMIYFGLDKAQTGRYVGFRVIEGANGAFAAGSEIDLYKEKFTSVPETDAKGLKASELELVKTEVSDTTEPAGKMITFTFAPAQFGGGQATVVEKVVMYDGDHFMRKFLEVELEDKTARINFIDGEHLVTAEDDTTWSVPKKSGVVAMDTAKATLGQPIYVNGLFVGSEFPETDTQIADGLGRTRYWTGKNFEDFERDNQLTTDGKYVSWQTVCGATHSDGSDMNLVQSDFFAYITSISKPSEFRIQYNSWFDNMMFIDDENIIESFQAVDKHLSETGVRPLESYVVDDGWNQYRKTENQYTTGDDLRRNGSLGGDLGINTTGFWQFNNKFPNGLTPSSELVNKLGSNFGVWIGPRGGYNYYGNLASIIQEAGKGSSAGGSIDVADQRYVDNFTDMAVKWMEDYGVNYWKWDGFADGGQYGDFASGEGVVGYDEDHQHMYGGPNGYYHATDLWEKWIVLFERVWETADAEDIEDLWISLTCYVNPSPWFLQWSNSVWIQCVADRGERWNSVLNNKMDNMLTYRDGCYYDFVEQHEFQFPLANLYNHDPIYGKEGTGITSTSMNGEQFRNYLFMQGTRGTAFWELYYSDSLFDEEKYLINADFLAWEEENFDMLRNAKMIGGNPDTTATLSGGVSQAAGTQDAYGFAGFDTDGTEGIISMRNPAAETKTITFKLDDAIGAKAKGTWYKAIDHSYTANGDAIAESDDSYAAGAEVTVTLKPGEVQIWHLTQKADTTAPELSNISFVDESTVRVQTSEHVSGAAFEVTVNGEKVELGESAVTAYADLKTFDIALPEALADDATVEVKATAGTDSVNNRLAGTVSAQHYTDGVVAQDDAIAAGTELSSAKRSVEGANGFTVTATVDGALKNATVLSQGDQWSLSVNAEGKAVFTVAGVSAVSDDALVEGDNVITGVRENNGMVKIYVDGEIAGSDYDADTVGKAMEADAVVAGVDATNVAVYDNSLGYDEVPASPLAELIAKIEAEQGNFTEESWTAANMDALLEAGKAALEGDDAAVKQEAYDNLLDAHGKLVPRTVTNLATGADLSAAWVDGTTDTPVTNSGRALTVATDGNIDTNSYAIFGNDAKADGSYMQVDLGETCRIDAVNLWRYWQDGRTYNGTALVVANKADFSDAQVLYYSGDQDLYGLGENALTDDELYAESSNGKVLYGDAEGDQSVAARYVRLYGHGVKNGGKENHVVELQVMGARLSADPYDLAGLKALIAQAETALENKDDYTADSIEALNAPLAAAKEVVETIEGGATDKPLSYVINAREALKAAIDALELVEPEPQPVEYTVTFDYGYEGAEAATVKVLEGQKVAKPADPVRDGYTFKGWMLDGKAYDFDAEVTGDITLIAAWEKVVDPDTDPENPGTDPENPNSKPGGQGGKPNGKPGSDDALAKTGDASMAIAGGVAAMSAVSLAGAAAVRRRRK